MMISSKNTEISLCCFRKWYKYEYGTISFAGVGDVVVPEIN